MSETNTLITVNSPCLDRLYRINAWRDNNLTISLVQGEGVRIPDDVDNNNPSSITVNGIKAPRFQLCDGSGIINLSNSPQIEWAILRPDGGGEDIVPCNIKDAAQGIIEIPITTSSTEYAGHIRGEVRLITDEHGMVKFFGIDACVGIGVSDDAAEQSTRFSALLEALQKVVALDTGGEIATLDTVIDGQHTNPVASRVIYNYLTQNYSTTDEMTDAIADAIGDIAGLSFQIVETLPAVQDAQSNVIYLVPTEQEGIYAQWVVINNQWRQVGGTQGSGGLKLKKAYETGTPASIVGSNIYENDALDSKTLYQYYNKNGVYIAWMLCAHTPSAMTAQLRFAYDGGIRVRTRSNNVWSAWNLIATKEYTDGKFVDKSRTIAGINLQNDISAAALKTALSVPTKTSDLTNDIGFLKHEIVQSLPNVHTARLDVVYLVPTETNNVYTAWIAKDDYTWNQIGSTGVELKKAYNTNTPASIVGSNVYENDALDSKTIYQYHYSDGTYGGWMICACVDGGIAAQVRFSSDGTIQIRTYDSDTWSVWRAMPTYTGIESLLQNTYQKKIGYSLDGAPPEFVHSSYNTQSGDLVVGSDGLTYRFISSESTSYNHYSAQTRQVWQRAAKVFYGGSKDSPDVTQTITRSTSNSLTPPLYQIGDIFVSWKTYSGSGNTVKDIWVCVEKQIIAGTIDSQSAPVSYTYTWQSVMPTVPRYTSDLTNDSGFLTEQDIAGKMDLAQLASSSEDVDLGQLFLTRRGLSDYNLNIQLSQSGESGEQIAWARDIPDISGKADIEDVPTSVLELDDIGDFTSRYFGSFDPTSGTTTVAVRVPCLWEYDGKVWFVYADTTSSSGGILQHDYSAILLTQSVPDVSGKEDKSNKVETVQNSSSTTQYPSVNAMTRYVTSAISGKADASDIPDVSGKENVNNKVEYVQDSSSATQYPSIKAMTTYVTNGLSNKESTTNRVSSINASSDNNHYPTALAVKNYVDTVIGGIENGSY